MAITFDGGFGFTEEDLPKIEVNTTWGTRYAETENGSWSWDIDSESSEDALETVKAHLAYWLWRQRNPELVAPVDEVAKADILSAVIGAEWEDAEDLAELLARAGFRRG